MASLRCSLSGNRDDIHSPLSGVSMLGFIIPFIFSLAFFIIAAFTCPTAQWDRYCLGLKEEKKEKFHSSVLWKKYKSEIFDATYMSLSILAAAAIGLANRLDGIQPISRLLVATPLALVTLGLLCWRIHRIWRRANPRKEADSC